MNNLNILCFEHTTKMIAMRIRHAQSPLRLAIAAIVGLLASASSAWAYDATSTVNFNVTGNIEEPVCEVFVKPSNAISLGTVSSQRLTGKPGASSDTTTVSLAFDNCSTGTSSVTITFSGAPFDSTYPTIYVGELIDGAKDVGLQLVSAADGKTLGPNESYTYAFTASPGGHAFDMAARMYTPYGKVTPGNVAYTVTFNVSYK